MVKQRLALELGQVDSYLRDHFRVCYGIDQDLHRQAIEGNIQRLQLLLQVSKLDHSNDRGRQPQVDMTFN
jgi:hypothetical protein